MKTRSHKIIVIILAAFLLIVAGEQVWKYRVFRSRIGSYAYSLSYALRTIGREGQYIGRIADVRWNAMPVVEGDIKGWQPRYLIARETLPGATEERWLCAYLIESAATPPARFKPSPFPPIHMDKNVAP
ncbi:MAG: hypothetical protein JXR73_05965 [Candidatus Omnitrophica bacterium]|nr:hypothetical protein [Candidatus Omnitrophota bacterium]